jgi:hypothetical protein
MIDTRNVTVEIKITPDPKHGHRVWIHVGETLVVRVYRAKLILDGVALSAMLPTAEQTNYD